MFLLSDTSVKVVLVMFFLTLSNSNILFLEQELIWRSYIAAKAIPNTKQVEIINKNAFAKAVLDKNVKVFMVYITSLSLNLLSIYSIQEA